MKKLQHIIITVMFIMLIYLLNPNKTYAFSSLDDFIDSYTVGTYVDDKDGEKVYWMTKGKTSFGEMGFSSVGVVISYYDVKGNAYKVEFIEEDNNSKSTSIASGSNIYIHHIGEKRRKENNIDMTYDLYYLEKSDIINAFINKYPNVDFTDKFIYNSAGQFRIYFDSIMTGWIKEGGKKVSQCGTLSENNYTVSSSKGNYDPVSNPNGGICRDRDFMRQYYNAFTKGSIYGFKEYYGLYADISTSTPSINLTVNTPIFSDWAGNKYYKKYSSIIGDYVYWVKEGQPFELKLESKVTDGGVTAQPNWAGLLQKSGRYENKSLFTLDRGYYKSVGSIDKTVADGTVNHFYYNTSNLFTDGYKFTNSNVNIYRTGNGYDTLTTYVKIQLKKGNTPCFYNWCSVQTSSDGSNASRVELGNKTSEHYINVWADGTAPTISFNGFTSNWTNVTPQIISINASDRESGVSKCYFTDNKNTSKIISKEGKTNIIAYSEDNVGNFKTTTKTLKIDTKAPTVELDTNLEEIYYLDGKTIKFTVTDMYAGIKKIEFSTRKNGLTKDKKTFNSTTSSGKFLYAEQTMSFDFSYEFTETTSIQVYVEDYAGNTKTYLYNIQMDTEPPKVTNVDLEYGWTNGTVAISPIITDNLSGVASYTLYDENNNEIPTSEYSATDDFRKIVLNVVRFSEEQDTTYRIVATDFAGNTNADAPFEFKVKIDTTPPTINGVSFIPDNEYSYKGEPVYYLADGKVDSIANDPKTHNPNFINEIASGMATLELKDDNGVIKGEYSVENGGLLDAYADIFSIIYDLDINTQKFWYLVATDRAGNPRIIKLISNKKIVASYVTIIPIENYN